VTEGRRFYTLDKLRIAYYVPRVRRESSYDLTLTRLGIVRGVPSRGGLIVPSKEKSMCWHLTLRRRRRDKVVVKLCNSAIYTAG
jgi:hypothetical protein